MESNDRQMNPERVRINGYIRRAKGGDADAMPMVKKFLDDLGTPTIDLAKQSREALITAIAGNNLYFAENLRRQCEILRSEIAAEGASPLEALLTDRIIACWLGLQYFEAMYAQQMHDLDIEWSEFHQRRLDRANRRYLAALKSLADVRRLRIPLMQLNIADKQVNLFASSHNESALNPTAAPMIAAPLQVEG